MLISIDKYYNSEFYNRCLTSLTNNKVKVKQFISPVSLKWFLDVPTLPVMLDFEICPDNEKRFLLSKTIAVYASDQYRLYRRTSDYGILNPEMIRADYMVNNRYGCFFHLRNREDGHNLSKAFNTKIFYLGKYYNNKYRLCLCTDPNVKSLLSGSDVLYEKSESISWIQAEYELNQKVFMLRDYLVKFTRTPYFDNHKFVAPNYFGDLQKRFFTF